MAFVDATPFSQLRTLTHPSRLYQRLMATIVRLAEHGLVHCDYNEFNLLIHEEGEEVTVIDFPQMVSTHHANAKDYFDRDVACIQSYFKKRYGYEGGEAPSWDEDVRIKVDLGVGVKASGSDVGEAERKEFERRMERYNARQQNEDEDGDEEEGVEEDEEEDVGEDITLEEGEMKEAEGALADEVVETVDGLLEEEGKGAVGGSEDARPEAGVDAGEEDAEDAAFRARMRRKEQRQEEEKARQLKRQQRKQPQPPPDSAAPALQDDSNAAAESEAQGAESGEGEAGSGDEGFDDAAAAAKVADAAMMEQIKAALRRSGGRGGHRGGRGQSSLAGRSRNVTKDRKAHKVKADMHAQIVEALGLSPQHADCSVHHRVLYIAAMSSRVPETKSSVHEESDCQLTSVC